MYLLDTSVLSAAPGGGSRPVRRRPLAGALIAATAKVHDLVVVTRNVRDYERFMPIEIVNPWDRDTWVRA